MTHYRDFLNNQKHCFANRFSALFFWMVLLLSSPFLLWSQQQFNSPVEGVLGKSGAGDQTLWAFFSNPAGLAWVNRPLAGVGYNRDYHLKELSSRALFVVLPTRWLVVGGGLVHQGFEHFNYQQYSVTTSRQMAPWLNLSLRSNITVRHQTGIEDRTLFTLDAGLQLQTHEQVKIGFYANNPAQTKWRFYGEEGEYHPSIVGASITYFPSSNVDMELGILKQSLEATRISFALSAPIHSNVILRGAASSAPIRLAFGIGLNWQGFTFDMGINHHAFLGFSSAFGIIYTLRHVEKSKE